MTTLELTHATPEHARAVAVLLCEFNREFATPSPSVGEFERRFSAMLARRDVLVLLAGAEPDWSGFALLTTRPTPYYDGPLAQLEELYVVPALRGQGIGSQLLLAAMAELSRRGAGELHINVDEVDTDTRRFYERHGLVNIEPGTDYRMLCYLRELPVVHPESARAG